MKDALAERVARHTRRRCHELAIDGHRPALARGALARAALLGALPAGCRVAALEAGRRLVEAAVPVRVEPPRTSDRRPVGALALDHLDTGLGQLLAQPV